MSAPTPLVIVLTIALTAPALAQSERTISIDFEDAPVKDALQQLETRCEVKIVSGDLEGTVNASIKDGTLPQALTATVAPLGFRWRKVVIPRAEDEEITPEDLSGLIARVESIGYARLAIEDPRENKVTRLVTEDAGGLSIEGEAAPDGRIYTAVYYVYDPNRKPTPRLKEPAAETAPQGRPDKAMQPPANLRALLYDADPSRKATAFLEVLRGTILSDMPLHEMEQMMMSVGQQMTPLEVEQIADFMRESLRRIDEVMGG